MHLNPNWVAIILSIFSVLLLPALVILVRGAVKWTRTEDRLGTLVDQVEKLVDDKDKVHAAILEQLRADRESTDRRLRFFEEQFMIQGAQHLTGGQSTGHQTSQS